MVSANSSVLQCAVAAGKASDQGACKPVAPITVILVGSTRLGSVAASAGKESDQDASASDVQLKMGAVEKPKSLEDGVAETAAVAVTAAGAAGTAAGRLDVPRDAAACAEVVRAAHADGSHGNFARENAALAVARIGVAADDAARVGCARALKRIEVPSHFPLPSRIPNSPFLHRNSPSRVMITPSRLPGFPSRRAFPLSASPIPIPAPGIPFTHLRFPFPHPISPSRLPVSHSRSPTFAFPLHGPHYPFPPPRFPFPLPVSPSRSPFPLLAPRFPIPPSRFPFPLPIIPPRLPVSPSRPLVFPTRLPVSLSFLHLLPLDSPLPPLVYPPPPSHVPPFSFSFFPILPPLFLRPASPFTLSSLHPSFPSPLSALYPSTSFPLSVLHPS
ncbi:unnamed protein product [Closterium sp. Naga37s-1]|nr:unnamed protein product [Closterium sp. Naga37s-1]